ncbi:MAG: putative F420-dependent oxidoreductase [Myxococcota bacterium]
MKFGLIPGYYAAPVATADYAKGLACLAEDLGFESIWPVEHVVMPEEYTSTYPYSPDGRMPIPDAAIPDPIIWNTWAAAHTTNLIVGTAMTILPQHNPVVYAKALASLDALSGGRVILGAGVGWLREEAEAVGTDFSNRGKRTDEYIDAMKVLWSDRIASYSGDYVSFDRVKCSPHPVQAGGIPIHIGGHSKAAARRAGLRGDGFLPLGGSLSELGDLFKLVEDTAKEAGRDASKIELTYSGMASHDAALEIEQTGAHRMLIASLDADLETAKRTLGEFSENVISKFGSA